MPFGFQMPRKRPDHLNWSTLQVPCNAKFPLYLAGPPVGVHCHRVGVTKPCRSHMTSGILACDRCKPDAEPEWRGYLPCYDDDDGRHVVLFGRDLLDRVLKVPLHAPILVSRGSNPRNRVEIKAERPARRKLRFDSNIPGPADIRQFLLVLWKDSELAEWLGKRWTTARKPDREKLSELPALKPSVAEHNPDTHRPPEDVRKRFSAYTQELGKLPTDSAAPPPAPPELNGHTR